MLVALVWQNETCCKHASHCYFISAETVEIVTEKFVTTFLANVYTTATVAHAGKASREKERKGFPECMCIARSTLEHAELTERYPHRGCPCLARIVNAHSPESCQSTTATALFAEMNQSNCRGYLQILCLLCNTLFATWIMFGNVGIFATINFAILAQ